MESADHSLSNPDCKSTADVPSFTLRTALAMAPFIPGYLLYLAYRSLRVPRLFASGFPGAVCLFEKPKHPSLAKHNPMVVHCSTGAAAVLSSLSLPLWEWWLLGLLLVVRQTSEADSTLTHVRFSHTFGEDANTHEAISCVPFKKYLHGCRAMDPWLLLP